MKSLITTLQFLLAALVVSWFVWRIFEQEALDLLIAVSVLMAFVLYGTSVYGGHLEKKSILEEAEKILKSRGYDKEEIDLMSDNKSPYDFLDQYSEGLADRLEQSIKKYRKFKKEQNDK